MLKISFLTKKLLCLENKHNLLEYKINDVRVWQVLRIYIYTYIQKKINNNKEALFPRKRYSILDFFKKLYFITILNPFLDFKKSEALVFQSGRILTRDNEKIDVFTHDLCLELKKNNTSFTQYGLETLTVHSSLSSVKQLDFLQFITKLCAKLITPHISKEELDFIKKLENEIFELFNVTIDLKSLFYKEIKHFKASFKIYSFLFSLKAPKKIYFIANNGKAAMIFAAKTKNIKSIEIQHGLMLKEDLIYHYPESPKDSLDYFPDQFFIWEKSIWKNNSVLPLTKNNIIEFGNKNLQYFKNKTRIKKVPKSILVISQQTVTKELLNYMLANLKTLKNYTITYKLHPREIINKTNEQKFGLLKTTPNVQLADNTVSIYDLLAKTEYVIGVYSTAVIEAQYFNCKIKIINLHGADLLNYYKSTPNIEFLDSSANLITHLN